MYLYLWIIVCCYWSGHLEIRSGSQINGEYVGDFLPLNWELMDKKALHFSNIVWNLTSRFFVRGLFAKHRPQKLPCFITPTFYVWNQTTPRSWILQRDLDRYMGVKNQNNDRHSGGYPHFFLFWPRPWHPDLSWQSGNPSAKTAEREKGPMRQYGTETSCLCQHLFVMVFSGKITIHMIFYFFEMHLKIFSDGLGHFFPEGQGRGGQSDPPPLTGRGFGRCGHGATWCWYGLHLLASGRCVLWWRWRPRW